MCVYVYACTLVVSLCDPREDSKTSVTEEDSIWLNKVCSSVSPYSAILKIALLPPKRLFNH